MGSAEDVVVLEAHTLEVEVKVSLVEKVVVVLVVLVLV